MLQAQRPRLSPSMLFDSHFCHLNICTRIRLLFLSPLTLSLSSCFQILGGSRHPVSYNPASAPKVSAHSHRPDSSPGFQRQSWRVQARPGRFSIVTVLFVSHPGLDLLFQFRHWFQHAFRQCLPIEGVCGGIQKVPEDDGSIHDGPRRQPDRVSH